MSLSNLVSELNRWSKATKENKSTSRIKVTSEEIEREASKYRHLSDWQAGHARTYESAWRQGRLKEFSGHMVKKINNKNKGGYRKKKTSEEIQLEANKYHYISDWQAGSLSTYMAAYKSHGIAYFTKHMTRKPSSQNRRGANKDEPK